MLGDVVICPQVADEQAAQPPGTDWPASSSCCCTHGILHLLGHDHAEPEEHARMFGLQDNLLARLARTGLSDVEPSNGSWLWLPSVLSSSCLAGLLVAAETALGRVSRSRVEEMAREKPGKPHRAGCGW